MAIDDQMRESNVRRDGNCRRNEDILQNLVRSLQDVVDVTEQSRAEHAQLIAHNSPNSGDNLI